MILVSTIDMKKYFPVRRTYAKDEAGVIKAVDGVSLEIEKGMSFGLVGESGCGKTTLGKIILGIVKPDSGSVIVGTHKVQVIFQDPYTSLDPKMAVFDILAEALTLARTPKDSIARKIGETLDFIKLPESALKKYPHQFSGGERQRIAIGRALLTEPEFIVCDEPVSNLDVTIQLQILNLLKSAQERFGMTYLFISHDLRVVKFMCDRVAVMRHGKIVESGATQHVWSSPSHPYTKLLLSSVLDVYARGR